MAAPTISTFPIPTTRLPPEIAREPEKSLIEIYLAGFEQAEMITGNAEDAIEVLHTSFIKLFEDLRWNPDKGTLRAWFLLIVKNECKKLRASRGPERHALHVRRGERFYREAYDSVATPEDLLIRAKEEEADDDAAPARKALCRRIYARVAHNDDATALVRHWATSDEKLSFKEIAMRLGIPIDRIYAAKKVIERAAKGEQS